jgi:hypothetical protein
LLDSGAWRRRRGIVGAKLDACIPRPVEEILRFGRNAVVWYKVAARAMRTLVGRETSDDMRQFTPDKLCSIDATRDYVYMILLSARIRWDKQYMAASRELCCINWMTLVLEKGSASRRWAPTQPCTSCFPTRKKRHLTVCCAYDGISSFLNQQCDT